VGICPVFSSSLLMIGRKPYHASLNHWQQIPALTSEALAVISLGSDFTCEVVNDNLQNMTRMITISEVLRSI
jgi:hypothetical protein